MILIFRRPDYPPSLNGNDGLLRLHWSKRKKVLEKFMWMIRGMRQDRLRNPCTLVITNYYARVPMDWDNLAGRLKIVGDALVKLKLIKDDSPKFIESCQLSQIKVDKLDKEQLVFTFLERPSDHKD